jgi:hypothetical protein
MYLVTRDGPRAAKMSVLGLAVAAFALLRFNPRGNDAREPAKTSEPISDPIDGPAIVAEIICLVLPRNRTVGIDWGAVFDLPPREVYEQKFLVVLERPESMRRQQDLAAWQPRSRISDNITDLPASIVEIEVFDVTDVAIGRAKPVSIEGIDVMRHDAPLAFDY